MSARINRTVFVCWKTLVAMLVLTSVVACGRVEPSSSPAQLTGVSNSAIATASLTEEPPEKISIATPFAEGLSLQGTAMPTGARIPRRSAFEFHSDRVGDWYKVYIGLPGGYDPQHPVGYPVIYLLDADWYFDGSSTMIGDGGVAGIVSSLSESGRIPRAIVVGIGYVGRNQRGRDLLWAYEKFYAFLTEELIPFVDGEYRTDAAVPRTLVGHSDGGYFALYAFFQSGGYRDAPFGQFVAISGDLTKNEWLPFREEGRMHRRIGEGGDVGAALFLAVGGQDETRFVTSNQDMAARLKSRQYQDLRFKSRVYASDDHMSVVTPAVWAGLMWVFGR